MEQDFVDIVIAVSYALLGIAALAAIVMPLINAIGNPKTLITGAIGVVFLLVMFGIAYSLSGGEVTPIFSKFGIDSGLSKYVGATIITTYLLIFLALVGIVGTEISKIFK
jgi:hypothetical protein